MVLVASINLIFPCNTLQLVNYVKTNYSWYNVYLPNITLDSQLGTIVTFVKVNGATDTSTPATGTGGVFYLGVQGSNVFFSSTLTTSTYFLLGVVNSFIAIKNSGGTYGWLQTL